MNTPTIPEIAEMLREHVRQDVYATKAIIEYVLPVIGLDKTYEEFRDFRDLRDAENHLETLENTVDNTRRLLTNLSTTAEEASKDAFQGATDTEDEDASDALTMCEVRFETIAGDLKDIIETLKDA